jgi:hypothetical protein
MDREANLIGGLLDDLDGEAGCGCRTLTSIARVGEDTFDEGERTPRGPQHRPSAVAVLDARRVWNDHQSAPVGIHQGVALAPEHLLGSIVTLGPPLSVVLID